MKSAKFCVLFGAVTLAMWGASANAFSLGAVTDAVKSKTESRETLLVYDLAGFTGSTSELLTAVRRALSLHGNNAVVHEDKISTQVPDQPGRITFRAVQLPIGSVTLPSCPEAAFTVSSNDTSLAGMGEDAFYMACGYRYSGGIRVNFYARTTSTSGGVTGLLSGKTIATAVTRAVGLKSAPQDFIHASIAKIEESFSANNWSFAIVEMAPAIEGKVLAEDPLKARFMAKADEEKERAQRSRRIAARTELRNLGYDATSPEQFRKAILAGDEDAVALFLDAGVVNPNDKDETGNTLVSYASKDSVRRMLSAR
jgi:hypothetical protein